MSTKPSAAPAPASNLIFLFALGATGIATGAQFASPSIGIYAAIVGAGGIIGMIVSKAGLGKATLAFLVSSCVAALLYYFVIAGKLHAAANSAATGQTADVKLAADQAGEAVGNTIGALVAVLAFVQTFLPGFLGSAVGALVRPKQKKTAPTGRASQPVIA